MVMAAAVTCDVAPCTVVGGNPAQLIKQRYADADQHVSPSSGGPT
ncbi:MAG: hypothetical protein ACRDRW_17975 [Pseudonocardiaceae bacterium]